MGAIEMLQFGHGTEAVETTARPLPARQALGFNSATARRPWKPSVIRLAGAVYHRFNSATARRPWKRQCGLRYPPRGSARFNSATARRPWKPFAEPILRIIADSFNSATARRPWKH